MRRRSGFGRVIETARRERSDSNAIRLARTRQGDARAGGGHRARETRNAHATRTDVKGARAAVLRVRWPVRVTVGFRVCKMTLRREVDDVLDELTHPGDKSRQEEHGQTCRNDASHGWVILGVAWSSVNFGSKGSRSGLGSCPPEEWEQRRLRTQACRGQVWASAHPSAAPTVGVGSSGFGRSQVGPDGADGRGHLASR